MEMAALWKIRLRIRIIFCVNGLLYKWMIENLCSRSKQVCSSSISFYFNPLSLLMTYDAIKWKMASIEAQDKYSIYWCYTSQAYIYIHVKCARRTLTSTYRNHKSSIWKVEAIIESGLRFVKLTFWAGILLRALAIFSSWLALCSPFCMIKPISEIFLFVIYCQRSPWMDLKI